MAVFNPDYEAAIPEYTKDYPFSEIIFPEDVPLCAKDLNELQRIFGFQLSSIAKNAFDSAGREKNGIFFAPTQQDVNIYTVDETYHHSVFLTGFIITDKHVFDVHISKEFETLSEKGSLVMVPSIITIDETSEIKVAGENVTLPNYLDNNRFLESTAKREALKLDFVLTDDAVSLGDNAIVVYDAVKNKVISANAVAPKDFYEDFHEYWRLYNQPYLLSKIDELALNKYVSENESVEFGSFRILWRGRIALVKPVTVTENEGYMCNGCTYLMGTRDGEEGTGFTVKYTPGREASADDITSGNNWETVPLLLLYRGTVNEEGTQLTPEWLPENFCDESFDYRVFGRYTNRNIVPFDDVPDSEAKRRYLAISKENTCNRLLIEQEYFENGAWKKGLVLNLRTSGEHANGGPSASSWYRYKQILLDESGKIRIGGGTVNEEYGVQKYDEKTLAFEDETAQIGKTTVNFAGDGWALDDQTGMYTQTVAVNGLRESDIIFTDVALSSDKENWDVQIDAYQCVRRLISSDGKITAYCTDEAPTAAFGVQLIAMRSNTNILN